MSRTRRRAIFAFCALVLAFVVWLDRGVDLRQSVRPESGTEQQTTGEDFERYNGKAFKVVKVVDGDTIDIDIPDADKSTTRIRLWGVDTPETKKPGTPVMYFGPEATKFTTEKTLNKDVTIYLDEKTTRGYYGRILAYVQLEDKTFLNEELLSNGYAYADLRFRHGYYHKYIQLQAAAKSGKRGLWKNVTREQLPEWLRKKKPTLLLDK